MNESGRIFYFETCNGVTALATATTYAEIEAWRDRQQAGNQSEPCPGPVFTFVSPDRFVLEAWHTGNHALKAYLTRDCVVRPGSLSVPFSHGEMFGDAKSIRRAVRRVGTLDQAMAAFGLVKEADMRHHVDDEPDGSYTVDH